MKQAKVGSQRSREATAIILLALAVFLFVSLISYQAGDPCFSRKLSPGPEVHNWGGTIGSYTADALIRSVGIAAAWIPLVLLLISMRLLLRDMFVPDVLTVTGFIGLVASTSGLLELIGTDFRIVGTEVSPGGILGNVIVQILHPLLNTMGSAVFLVPVFVLSLMVTMDLSVVAFFIRIAEIVRGAFLRLKKSIDIMREKSRRSKQVSREIREKETRTPPVIAEENIAPEKKTKPKKVLEQATFDFIAPKGAYVLPPLTLLDEHKRKESRIKKESLLMNARILEKKLADFGVEGKVLEVKPGPLIAMYELEPAPGVKLNRITNLSDDLAMALKAPSIRIAPIPGKSVVGIEIPNNEREPVHLKSVLDNDGFLNSKYRLPIALGEDNVGTPVIADLARMPHLLIAGTTGSGKSVSLNAMICSILLKSTPDEVKFLMIDPKRIELSEYEGIPHLLHPVVVNPKDASMVLRWAVLEMERRYRIISEVGAKNIDRFNQMIEKPSGKAKPAPEPEAEDEDDGIDAASEEAILGKSGEKKEIGPIPRTKLPYIVIVIDEMADLMMVAQRNVEESLTRLAQMARAAGIHLILATQRPSVDVITGIIKANFPTRISFQVSSKVDSRTILDQLGAEQLLGMGDMLFMPPGTSRLARIHGAYVSDKEIEQVVAFVKKQGKPSYDETILKPQETATEKGEEEYDEKYDEAVELVTDLGQASISLVQRYMKIGYNRAARIIERMEAEGVVGPSDGVKPRKVLARKLSH